MLNRIVWNRTVYKYKIDLALNNLQCLICHKIKPNLRFDFVFMGEIGKYIHASTLHGQWMQSRATKRNNGQKT